MVRREPCRTDIRHTLERSFLIERRVASSHPTNFDRQLAEGGGQEALDFFFVARGAVPIVARGAVPIAAMYTCVI